MSITRNQNSSSGPTIALTKTRSTSDGGNGLVSSGDSVGSVVFVGADGNDTAHAAASIEAAIDGTAAGDDLPGRLMFSTTADGASAVTERMRISNSGALGLNTAGNNDASTYYQFDASGTYLGALVLCPLFNFINPRPLTG